MSTARPSSGTSPSGEVQRPAQANGRPLAALRAPKGAIDTHVHVFDPPRFPFAADTRYRPTPAECGRPEDLARLLEAHGFAGALLVNPTSGYGDDNCCMLDALARSGGRWRGIARVPIDASKARLRVLAGRGVAGVRVDLIGDGLAQIDSEAFPRLCATLADLDLVLEVQCEHEQMTALVPRIADGRFRVVVDHCGRPDPARGPRQAGFAALLRLAETDRVAVKLSGAFRFVEGSWPYVRADRYVADLLDAFGPDRCVWGSDWPFLRTAHRIDYAPTLSLLARWVPDARLRRRILVDTPRRWFGFPPC